MKKRLLALLCAVVLVLSLGVTAFAADDYPSGPITMIIPYGAGGTTDLVGRQLAIALEKQLGVSIVVENQAGASGTTGLQITQDAEPDGYTIVLAAESLGTCRVMTSRPSPPSPATPR